jgi:hypothetical protein
LHHAHSPWFQPLGHLQETAAQGQPDGLGQKVEKKNNKLSLVAPVIWAEEEATLIPANLMALRKAVQELQEHDPHTCLAQILV